jgi:hypothetical protein
MTNRMQGNLRVWVALLFSGERLFLQIQWSPHAQTQAALFF